MVRDVVVCCAGTGHLPGVTPVLKLLLEQGGLIVLSQAAKHCPVRPALAFSTHTDNDKAQILVINIKLFKTS